MLFLKMTKKYALGLLTFASIISTAQATDEKFHYQKLEIMDRVVQENSPQFLTHLFSTSEKYPLNGEQYEKLIVLQKKYVQSLNFLIEINKARKELLQQGFAGNMLEKLSPIASFEILSPSDNTYQFVINKTAEMELKESLVAYKQSLLTDPFTQRLYLNSWYQVQIGIIQSHIVWVHFAGSRFKEYITAAYNSFDPSIGHSKL